MQKRGLRKRRKRLVDALDHNIRAKCLCRHRKCLRKAEMRAMRLIHDERDPVFMHDPRNRFDIRNHTVISRRCDDNGIVLFFSRQRQAHLIRPDRSLYSHLRDLRIQIVHRKFAQICRMIDRLMAVARHQQSAAFRDCSAYRCKQSAGASVHEIKGLFRAKHLCRVRHAIF